MKTKSTCPKCGSEEIRRVGLRGLIVCAIFVLLFALVGNVLMRMGDEEMASDPEKYKNALSPEYEPSSDKYDFPLTTRMGGSLKAISNVLILYAIFLLVTCLRGKKKCTACKFKFKDSLSSLRDSKSSTERTDDRETSQIVSARTSRQDRPSIRPSAAKRRWSREIMWAALLLIIVLTAMSIYGAFVGADRSQMFFNSTPSVVFWVLFALALIAGFVAFRRLIRVPGLLLMHVGCILVLIGGALGSEKGYRATGNDKILKGDMQIFEGQASKQVRTEKKIPLFDLAADFAKSLDARSIPPNLRQEFESKQAVLSQAAGVFVSQPGGLWVIADEKRQFYVRREGKKLKVYDFIREMKELPFAVKLNDFRIEYYEPKVEYLQAETASGMQRVVAEVGRQLDLGAEFGTAKIVRKFNNLKISIEDGKTTYYDDPNPGSNPALEIQITRPDGQVTSLHVFSLHPGFSHTQGGPKLVYSKPTGGAIRDYVSELEIVETNGKVLAQKDIEVNHPLYYAGYHFYQSSYDAQAGRYTVLQVVSDTGVKIVFAGYWMLCVGMVWHMWLRHLLKNIGRAAPQVSHREKQTHGN